MCLDKVLILFDDEDICGSATAETISTNVFDIDDGQKRFSDGASGDSVLLNAAINDLGRSGRAVLNVAVGSTKWLCTGGSGDVDIRLYEHTGATVTSGSIILSVNLPTITITTTPDRYVAGKYLFGLRLPKDIWGDTTNIVIGLAAIVNTQTLSTGSINAWIDEGYTQR